MRRAAHYDAMANCPSVAKPSIAIFVPIGAVAVCYSNTSGKHESRSENAIVAVIRVAFYGVNV